MSSGADGGVGLNIYLEHRMIGSWPRQAGRQAGRSKEGADDIACGNSTEAASSTFGQAGTGHQLECIVDERKGQVSGEWRAYIQNTQVPRPRCGLTDTNRHKKHTDLANCNRTIDLSLLSSSPPLPLCAPYFTPFPGCMRSSRVSAPCTVSTYSTTPRSPECHAMIGLDISPSNSPSIGCQRLSREFNNLSADSNKHSSSHCCCGVALCHRTKQHINTYRAQQPLWDLRS